MTVVIFDHNERVLDFLDEDRITMEQHQEYKGLKTLSLTYEIEEEDDPDILFELGNYVWVSGRYVDDCFYVMNTPVEQVYSYQNRVTIELEEVLTELNYTPLISQTDLTTNNGFTIVTTNGQKYVTIDYHALNYFFGRWFNIGIVQNCLNNYIQNVNIKGTMTRMSLLRYLEEETSNIFRTRYEKDPINNTIHRYLDFLNPSDVEKNWELNISYKLPATGDFGTFDENGNPTTPDTPQDINPNYVAPVTEDDDYYGPGYTPVLNYNLEDVALQITDQTGTILTYDDTPLYWDDDDLSLTSMTDPEIILQVKYNNHKIKVKVNGKSFTAIPADTAGDTIDNYSIVTLNDSISEVSDVTLPNNCRVQLFDTGSGKVFYEQVISPSAGDVHDDILDLTYNVENISYEVDETDTFTAISPVLSNDDSSESLTRTQMDTLINNWVNLSVKKGDLIPMIVQKITNKGQISGTSTPAGNYFARPLRPQDNIDNQTPANSTYEYWRGTAYWNAPFTKKAGQMHIEDPTISDVEYYNIHSRTDITDDLGIIVTPKMGTVETSDEDKYAIYNDVAMKLKDKRTPKINITVNVANYLNGKYNDYEVNDIVYVKIPSFDKLITAVVTKTTKNPNNITENTIELGNYSINNKVSTTETYITGKHLSVNYPGKAIFRVKLCDANGQGVNGKLLTFQLSKAENGMDTITRTTYNRRTTTISGIDGMVHLEVKYDPGNYKMNITFPGDDLYETSSTTIKLNVAGKKTVKKQKTVKKVVKKKKKNTKNTKKSSSKKKTKVKKKTVDPEAKMRARFAKQRQKALKQMAYTTYKMTHWTKQGVSPYGQYLMAIGKPSVTEEYEEYADALYRNIFYRECPICGSHRLFWYWGNAPDGNSYWRGTIVCKNCDAKFSVFGRQYQGNVGIPPVQNPVKVNAQQCYNLLNGKYKYKDVKIVKQKKPVVYEIERQHIRDLDQNHQSVIDKTWEVIGDKVGYDAARAIADYCCWSVGYVGYNDFHRGTDTVLRSGGNCCDQTRTMLQMMDIAGVSEFYVMKYVHVSTGDRGHIFARLISRETGNWVYVDPCCQSRGPWGNYITGYGSPPGSQYECTAENLGGGIF